jgi:hypothetical protein
MHCRYFGKSLADDPALAGVPIGLVGTFVGGTFIEQWIRQEKQAACTLIFFLSEGSSITIVCSMRTLPPQLAWLAARLRKDPTACVLLGVPSLSVAMSCIICYNTEGTETLCGTKDCEGYKCGSLYNGHIAPFVNQSISGMIWYQGENNVRNVAGSINNKTGYACQMVSILPHLPPPPPPLPTTLLICPW